MKNYSVHEQPGFICIVPDRTNGGAIGCRGNKRPVFRIGDIWACPTCLQRREVLEQIDKLFADKG